MRRPRPNAESARRINAAGFPRDKRLEDFDFAANPAINPAIIHQLATCEWVRDGQPLCLIGDSGTGKSHLLIALGTAAAEARLPGQLHPGLEAGQRARRGRRRQAAVQDHRPLRPRRPALHRRTRLHGTRPPRRRTALPGPHRTRGERSSVAIASNESFCGWTKTFTDPRLCAAIVDRLTFGGHIIETGTDSYRLAHARAARTKITNDQDHQKAS